MSSTHLGTRRRCKKGNLALMVFCTIGSVTDVIAIDEGISKGAVVDGNSSDALRIVVG